MKFAVRIFTVIPGETARSYEFVVEADSMDTAQIQLSRKIAHDWVEIPHENTVVNVRTSYIAATEIELVEKPVIESPPAPVEETVLRPVEESAPAVSLEEEREEVSPFAPLADAAA